MCYNISYIEKRAEKYEERFSSLLPEGKPGQLDLFDQQPQYFFVSGFAHPLLPVVKKDGIFFYEWGLIPSWAKDIHAGKEVRKMTLNARGETIFSKPAFRASIGKKRCLLGINGFYEWREYNRKKYPYFIRVKNEEIFSLGCIFENWVDKDTGEIKNTFSIVTTAANPLMEKIHNLKKRMPLIISRSDEVSWIDEAITSQEIKNLIKPFDEMQMEAYTVSDMVNNPRNNRNVKEAMAEVTYDELPPL